MIPQIQITPVRNANDRAALARFVEFKDAMTEAQLIEMARTGELPLPSVVSVNGRIVARG